MWKLRFISMFEVCLQVRYLVRLPQDFNDYWSQWTGSMKSQLRKTSFLSENWNSCYYLIILW